MTMRLGRQSTTKMYRSYNKRTNMVENKMEIKKEKKPKRLTVYEKFLRLPNVLVSQKFDVTIEYNFDIHFDTRYNDECSIEYTHYDPYFDCYTKFRYQYINEDVSWFGTFEECVEKAYAFFKKYGGLLKDENIQNEEQEVKSDKD